MTAPLLDIRDLKVEYRIAVGTIHAVDGVSIAIAPGETLGLVGESGCGKTTVGRAIVKVMPANAAIAGGQILYRGRDLVPLSYEDMRAVRWREIAVVPQSAMNALNPVYRVGRQIEEVVIEHAKVDRRTARLRAETLFRLVKIDPQRLDHYPHQFSGGMRQRALVAMALAADPSLLIADEPTTALDVVTQDRIFGRLRAIRRELGAAMLLITHDMGLVAENCDRVAVMYAGRVVEMGETRTLFGAPVHPYTLGLKNAFPSTARPKNETLISIPGSPPVLINPPRGCRFAPRCPFATALCREEDPTPRAVAPGHMAACHHLDQAPAMRAEAARSEAWSQAAHDARGRATP